MRLRLFTIGSLLAVAFASPASAGVFSDDLVRCEVNAATAADRALLGRWIFIVAGANPAFADLIAISDAERQQSNRLVASLFERLLLRDCRREAVAALRNEGAPALAQAFQTIGEVAGREMVSSPASMASAGEIDHYLDGAGLAALRREAGIADPPSPTAR